MLEYELYPYNNRRAMRATQLGADCLDMIAQLADDKTEIDALIAQANQAVVSAYGGMTQQPIEMKTETFSYGDTNWGCVIADVIAPILAVPLIDRAIMQTQLCYAARAKSVPVSALAMVELTDVKVIAPTSPSIVTGETVAPVVKLPAWMGACRIAAGMVTAISVALIVDVIYSSIWGATCKNQMRDAIHATIEPRIDLKRKTMINQRVKTALTAVITTLNAIKHTSGISPTTAQLDKITQFLIREHQVNVEGITRESTIAELAEYDRNRKAWTEEDDT